MRATNNLYKQYSGLIKKRANYYSKKYSLPFEDVESEANEVFCKACLSFDAERGTCFSTHLQHRLTALNNYCKALYREWVQIENIEEMYIPVNAINPVLFEDSLTALSQESQELVCSLIFDGGHKLTVAWIKEKLHIGYEKAKILYEEIITWWLNFKAEPVFM